MIAWSFNIMAQGYLEVSIMAGIHVQAPARQWVEVYELSGFAVGTGLLIQNQTSMTFSSVESDDAPTDGNQGRWIYPGTEAEITGTSRVWIWSDQIINAYVQERE